MDILQPMTLIEYKDPNLDIDVKVTAKALVNMVQENSHKILGLSQNYIVYNNHIALLIDELKEMGYEDEAQRPLQTYKNFADAAKAVYPDYNKRNKGDQAKLVEEQKTEFTSRYYSIKEYRQKVQVCYDDCLALRKTNEFYLSMLPQELYSDI